jgi:hypothetical protein
MGQSGLLGQKIGKLPSKHRGKSAIADAMCQAKHRLPRCTGDLLARGRLSKSGCPPDINQTATQKILKLSVFFLFIFA